MAAEIVYSAMRFQPTMYAASSPLLTYVKEYALPESGMAAENSA